MILNHIGLSKTEITMNNQLITPTEYEAKSPEEKDCYKEVWQLLNGHSHKWINASSQPDTCEDTFDEWCGYMSPIATRLMYAPIIPIKEELTVTRAVVTTTQDWSQQDLTFKVAAELENVFDIKYTGSHEWTNAYEIESNLSSIIESFGMKLVIEDRAKLDSTLGTPFEV